MPLEIPPLGKFVITSFEAESLAYPVVVVSRDPTVSGYVKPAIGDPCPDPRYSATHTFTGITVTNLDNRALWKYERIPGQILSGVETSEQANGALATTSAQILAQAAANYTPTWLTLSYSDIPVDANRKKRTVVTLNDSGFPVLTEYDQDPVLQYLIKTTFQIVEAAAVTAPTVSNGIIKQFKKIDKWRSVKIVEDHTNLLTVSYDEQRFDAASFPTLFDYTQYEYTDACGEFSTERSAFSAMVQSRTHVSFTATKQTIAGLTLLPKSLSLGRAVQKGNLLVDSGTFTYVGTCTGTVSFSGSDPDYSTYISTIQGTEQLITGESVLFRAGVYRNTSLYRTML